MTPVCNRHEYKRRDELAEHCSGVRLLLNQTAERLCRPGGEGSAACSQLELQQTSSHHSLATGVRDPPSCACTGLRCHSGPALIGPPANASIARAGSHQRRADAEEPSGASDRRVSDPRI